MMKTDAAIFAIITILLSGQLFLTGLLIKQNTELENEIDVLNNDMRGLAAERDEAVAILRDRGMIENRF
jgi:hypothetical protein